MSDKKKRKKEKETKENCACLQVMSMWLQGEYHEFRKAVPRKWARLGAAAEVADSIVSPMPGKVIQVRRAAVLC